MQVLEQKWVEHWTNWTLKWACVPMSLAIGYTLAQLTWFVLLPDHMVPRPPVSESNQVVSQVNSAEPVNINQLVDWHLFGKVQPKSAKPKEEPKQTTKAPVTRLKVELLGVFVAELPENSTAIIAEQKRAGKLYAIDDVIQGSVRLESVWPDRVVLRRNGRLETLYFPKNAPNSVINASQKRPKPVNKSRRNKITDVIEDKGDISPGKLIEAISDDLQQDRDSALKQLGLKTSIDGAEGSIQVTSSTPRQLRSMLGLRPGDVLISVGGYPATRLVEDQGLLEQLSQESKVQVEVERNNRRFKVNVTVPKGLKL